MPQRLLFGSVLAYVAVFVLLLAWGTPGLGIGQWFYMPIVLVAFASGTAAGAGAGAAAIVLYAAAELFAGREDWGALLSASTTVRLASYVVAGATVGHFAMRARAMLADSLHVLDELLALARRDATTGLRTGDVLEAGIEQRIARRQTFALLVADAPARQRRLRAGGDDEARRELARLLAAALEPAAELAALGPARYGAITEAATPAEARAAAAELERALHAAGTDVTVGWAFHPVDGDAALALVALAVERLHGRRVARGEWVPTAESTGLVEPLRRRD